jgi:hydrogenase nickel incorporation protein HypA/HybF
MHELSICRSIADIVTRHAGAGRVATIHLQIGQLRQVVPGTLTYCWSLVSADTPLAGSALAVDSIPGRLSCQACGTVSEMGRDPVFTCRSCGSADVRVVAGEEFMITSLDLAEA